MLKLLLATLVLLGSVEARASKPTTKIRKIIYSHAQPRIGRPGISLHNGAKDGYVDEGTQSLWFRGRHLLFVAEHTSQGTNVRVDGLAKRKDFARPGQYGSVVSRVSLVPKGHKQEVEEILRKHYEGRNIAKLWFRE